MNSLTQDLQNKLKNLNVLEQIIAVNVVVFFVVMLASGLFNWNALKTYLELPSDVTEFLYKPWTILTYGFTHYGGLHLFFNMMVLYFISRMMLNLFNYKMSLNIYFLGIIFGGVSYLFIYNVLPADMIRTTGALIGASAGVRALLIFLCAYMPQMEVRVVFFNMKLWHLGVAVVVLDIIGLFSINQGGHIAHLGGSALGYFYAVQLQKGTDIGKGFERLLDAVTAWFKPKGKKPLKTVYKRNSTSVAGHTKAEFGEFNKQKQIDLILDKISKSGYESLTAEEKAFLFKTKD